VLLRKKALHVRKFRPVFLFLLCHCIILFLVSLAHVALFLCGFGRAVSRSISLRSTGSRPIPRRASSGVHHGVRLATPIASSRCSGLNLLDFLCGGRQHRRLLQRFLRLFTSSVKSSAFSNSLSSYCFFKQKKKGPLTGQPPSLPQTMGWLTGPRGAAAATAGGPHVGLDLLAFRFLELRNPPASSNILVVRPWIASEFTVLASGESPAETNHRERSTRR